MGYGSRVSCLLAALLVAACVPDDGHVAPPPPVPEPIHYLVSYAGDRRGLVQIDHARRRFCSQGHPPWARAGHVHLRARNAADPVVFTLFEPPHANRSTACVERADPGVYGRINLDPESYYLDFHEAQRGGRTVRGKIGPGPPMFGGLEVDVPKRLSVRGGERFELQVAARDGDGRINGILVRFGDGTTQGGLPFDLVCDAITGDEDPREGPSALAETFAHAYRRAGKYTAIVEVASGGCFADSQKSRKKIAITVEGDAGSSNGPMEPRAKIGHAYYANGVRDLLVSDIGGYDADGWVYWMRVDWGDGSKRDVFRRGFGRCHAGRGWPEGWFSDPLRHRYAREGEYRVAVKVKSAGCDRDSVQTGRSKRVLEYPPLQGS